MESLRIRGACPHDCPDTCGVITEVQDGKAVHFRGDPDNPITRGWLCAKVRPYLDHVYHPDRLMYPLRRVGPKGGGQWRRISWTEALDEIAARWKAIVAESGAEAILPYSYSGTLGVVQMIVSSARLWNRLGASRLERSICCAAAETAVEATLGKRWSPPYDEIVNSRLVLIWGHNPVSSGPHFMPFLRQAQRAGCHVIVIDPHRTQTARGADWHLAPRPGTDGVLAMGLGHLLVAEGLHDETWLAAHTIGWPLLRERLAEYPPRRVAELTGLDEEDIRELARLYGARRPGLIKIADGINRNRNGGQNVRAICVLPALTGQYGLQGGGLAYSSSGYLQWDREAVHHWAECPPPGRAVNMNRLGAALLGELGDLADPPIMGLYVFGANPATSAPSAGRIVDGLRRDDLFTVVHELFLTDTADYADIVLPATTQLEHFDIHGSYGHLYVQTNEPAIAPLAEAKSNTDVFRLLARKLNFEPELFEVSDEELAAEALQLGPSAAVFPPPRAFGEIGLERLRREGPIRLNLPKDYAPFAQGGFGTPSGKCELYSPSMAAQGLEPLPTYTPPYEDPQTRPDLAARFPLQMVSPPVPAFLNSTFVNIEALRAMAGEPTVEIHPEDAAKRKIQDGQWVRIFNDRGSFQARAVVGETVKAGVVVSQGVWWNKFTRDGVNCNTTTSTRLTDLGAGATFFDNLVEVEGT